MEEIPPPPTVGGGMVSGSVREKGKKKGGGYGGVCVLANTKSRDTDCPVLLVPPPFFFPLYDPYTRTIPQGTKCRSGISIGFSTVQVELFLRNDSKNINRVYDQVIES